MIKNIIIMIVLTSPCLGDMSYITSEHENTNQQHPSKPYSFKYHEGRIPGHIDHIRQETADGAGNVQGSYSFIDPNHRIRTVQYSSDGSRYHNSLNNYGYRNAGPFDTEAVRQAKEQHYRLYDQIAHNNAQPTQDTESVKNAKDLHFYLYKKIALEHAAIGAARSNPSYNNYGYGYGYGHGY